MSNTLKVIDMIAKQSLVIAHEKATFISTVNRQFDDSYGKAGEKIGSALRVREPNQYVRRQGSRVMDVKDQVETTQTITMATQDGVDMRFNSSELLLDVDSPSAVAKFSERFIEPAISSLVSGIDGDCLTQATKDTYNTVGTAGTNGGSVATMGLARARLNQGLAPKDMNRAVQLDSVTMAAFVDAGKGLFMPENQIKKAFTEGFYGRNAMADFYENERTWTLANNADIVAATDAASLVTDGGIIVDMHTDLSVANSVVGSVFTIAGVYACHPETKQAYNYLQQFTIISKNAASVNVSPTIYLGLSDSTAARQNVCKADGTKLALTDFDAKTLTFHGSASTSYRQSLMYHKDAFAFVSADLPVMDDAHKCVVKRHEGLSIRVWMASDIRNDELLIRLDTIWGFKTFRPAWSTRITN